MFNKVNVYPAGAAAGGGGAAGLLGVGVLVVVLGLIGLLAGWIMEARARSAEAAAAEAARELELARIAASRPPPVVPGWLWPMLALMVLAVTAAAVMWIVDRRRERVVVGRAPVQVPPYTGPVTWQPTPVSEAIEVGERPVAALPPPLSEQAAARREQRVRR